MGLDVSFDGKKAVDNGMLVELYRPGYLDEINADYPASARNFMYLLHVPDSGGICTDVEITDDGSFIVRANKWGHVYEPLTTWLKQHEIEWGEF